MFPEASKTRGRSKIRSPKAALAVGVSMAALLPFLTAPAEAGGRYIGTCIGSPGVVSCVGGVPGGFSQIVKLPGPRDDVEAAASAERDRLWLARCRPVSRVDPYGVRRFTYVARGCEFGQYED